AITIALVSATWILHLVQPASAQQPSQATIIIESTSGVSGTADETEMIVIDTSEGTDEITVTLTAAERNSSIKKAQKIAEQVALQGAVVTAAAEKNVVRITPRRPATTLRVIDFDRGKVRQSIRINPKELRPAGSSQGQQGEQLQFGLVLTGMATDDDFL